MSCGCKCSYCVSCNTTPKVIHTITKTKGGYVKTDGLPDPYKDTKGLYTKKQAD